MERVVARAFHLNLGVAIGSLIAFAFTGNSVGVAVFMLNAMVAAFIFLDGMEADAK